MKRDGLDLDDRADAAYADHQQRLADARADGREAGRRGQSIEMDPFQGAGEESKEWRAGRMETLCHQNRRRHETQP